MDSGRPPRGWRWFLVGLFIAALAWRLVYLSRLGGSILGGSLVSDAEIYWIWADWLLEHSWWGKHAFYMGPL